MDNLKKKKQKLDDVLWQSFEPHIYKNLDIMNVSNNGETLIFEFDNNEFPGGRSSTSLKIHNFVTTLGIDIMKYSQGSTHERLISSVKLYAFIENTINWFKRKRPDLGVEPEVIIPTGDGALLVFKMHAKSIIEAVQFLLILNLRSYVHNIDVPPVGSKVPIVHIPIRFALGCGNAIFIRDVNDNKNVVGDTIINCSRILSFDEGKHFLIDKTTADCLIQNFGTLEDGINNAIQMLFRDFSVDIDGPYEKERKDVLYQFYNIKGTYYLNSLMDDLYEERQENWENKPIEIGQDWIG